jgi:methylmalonyl-CoA mutase N-terminal domain/subunit
VKIIRTDIEDVNRSLRMDPERYKQEKRRWLEETYQDSLEEGGPFVTVSSEPVDPVYGPGDVAGLDYESDLGFPGELMQYED